jgi:hypothetical protein
MDVCPLCGPVPEKPYVVEPESTGWKGKTLTLIACCFLVLLSECPVLTDSRVKTSQCEEQVSDTGEMD